mgnify:CR=1 FL=1
MRPGRACLTQKGGEGRGGSEGLGRERRGEWGTKAAPNYNLLQPPMLASSSQQNPFDQHAMPITIEKIFYDGWRNVELK